MSRGTDHTHSVRVILCTRRSSGKFYKSYSTSPQDES